MMSTRSKAASGRDHFPLLRLPAELRNRVYEFALTADTSGSELDLVLPKSRNGKPRVIIKGEKEDFNQLKYVLHQLYNECAGLEVKHNVIVVRGDRRTILGGPARRLNRFLETCSQAKALWFTHIGLSNCNYNRVDWVIEDSEDILPVADLRRTNPNLTVDYHAGILVSTDHTEGPEQRFLRSGTYMLSALRHENPDFLHQPYFNGFMNLNSGHTWTDEQGVARLEVPNLRFWPSTPRQFDETFGQLVEYIQPQDPNSDQYRQQVTRLALEWDEWGVW